VSGPLLSTRDGAMFSKVTDERHLDRLQDQLRRLQVIDTDLMSDLVAALVPDGTARAARINRLVQAEAWVEAALALIEIALPQWKPRGLVYQDGVWRCSLSRHRDVPDWLDDAAEASHETLALAILAASIEARRQNQGLRAMRTVPQSPIPSASQSEFMCADNFA
jgi:hypothetical protein